MLSNDELGSDDRDEIEGIVEGFIGLGFKEDCDWNIDYYVTSIDFDAIGIDKSISEIKKILLDKYGFTINLKYIEPYKFNFLSQD